MLDRNDGGPEELASGAEGPVLLFNMKLVDEEFETLSAFAMLVLLGNMHTGNRDGLRSSSVTNLSRSATALRSPLLTCATQRAVSHLAWSMAFTSTCKYVFTLAAATF